VNPLNSIAAPTLLSICVSKSKDVEVDGIIVSTGIFKLPVTGKVKVRRLNLNGDEQADLTVHGGPDKAVYAYPIEQYAYWKKELPNRELEWGSFGENLTVSGFTEDSVCIGDKLKIGTTLFAVTQPRIPCYKLGIRLGDPSMIKRFYKSAKWGFYLSVLEEGEIETGDQISHQGSDGNGITLADVSHCFLDPNVDASLFARVLQSNLAQQMKEHLEYNASRRK
jgi:MOSC domain-containing protein YiiM